MVTDDAVSSPIIRTLSSLYRGINGKKAGSLKPRRKQSDKFILLYILSFWFLLPTSCGNKHIICGWLVHSRYSSIHITLCKYRPGI